MKRLIKENGRWVVKEGEKLLRPTSLTYSILNAFISLDKDELERKEILQFISGRLFDYQIPWSNMQTEITFKKLLADKILTKAKRGSYVITELGKRLFQSSRIAPTLSTSKDTITTLPSFENMDDLPKSSSAEIRIENVPNLVSLKSSKIKMSGPLYIEAKNLKSLADFNIEIDNAVITIKNTPITSLQGLQHLKLHALKLENTRIHNMKYMSAVTDSVILIDNHDLVSFEGFQTSCGLLEIAGCNKNLKLDGFPKQLDIFIFDSSFPYTEDEIRKVCEVGRIMKSNR